MIICLQAGKSSGGALKKLARQGKRMGNKVSDLHKTEAKRQKMSAGKRLTSTPRKGHTDLVATDETNFAQIESDQKSTRECVSMATTQQSAISMKTYVAKSISPSNVLDEAAATKSDNAKELQSESGCCDVSMLSEAGMKADGVLINNFAGSEKEEADIVMEKASDSDALQRNDGYGEGDCDDKKASGRFVEIEEVEKRYLYAVCNL